MVDEITRAVLSRKEIAHYLQGSHGESGRGARARIEGYLEELRTTQRYSIYRALKHPLYPILRKIDRIGEFVDVPKAAARAGRVIYASNHRSHTDYLVEPLVLDDNGIRPPVIAAGINLFGGPLGLIHRHVTGAIPIRRNMRDPAYLLTLKAYVAELLRTSDFFFYPEGGRSYSGEIKVPKTGLMHAALQAPHPHVVVVPTAVVAAAMRPSTTRRELEQGADALVDALRAAGANLGVTSGAHAVDAALESLEYRGILVVNRGRVRVRNRNVLRYYARSIGHLLDSRPRRAH